MAITSITNQQLEISIAKQGVINEEEQIKVANEILGIIPEQQKAAPENAGKDEQQLAAEWADKYFELKNNMNPPVPGGQGGAPTADKKPGRVRVGIPAADAAKLAKYQDTTRAQRMAKSSQTEIIKLLGDKPYPGTYLNPGSKMIPKADVSKFEAYAKDLVEGEENRKAYDACMAAIKNNTEMDIYIPDATKWNPKNVGLVVRTPSDTAGEGQKSERTLTDKEAVSFVAIELAGYIPCDANHPGIKLGQVRQKAAKASARGVVLSPRVIIVNKKEAYAKPDQHEFISKPKANGGTPVMKEGTVRSALSFKIYTGQVTADGKKKTRTVRVSGKMQVPVFERTSAAYEEIFGAATKNNNVVTAPATAERAAYDELVQTTLFAIQQSTSNMYGDSQKKFAEEFSKIVGDAGAPVGAEAENFS